MEEDPLAMMPLSRPAPPARRRLLRGLAACSLALPGLAVLGGRARASGALRLLVGFPPGGGTDAIARVLAEKLAPALEQAVLVENRAGAGGQLAAQALKAAAPDGQTLLLSHDHTISILPLVLKQPGFDPARDFTPVAGFASFANALALSASTPATSLADYLAWVRKAGAGQGAVGVPAPASVPEFMVKALAGQAKLDLLPVPYRGSAPMMQDMLGGQIAAGVGSVPDFIENHRSGRLQVVAVMGSQRQPALPQVPTLAESGLAGFEVLPYYGVFAPAGTPRRAIDRFSAALWQVLERPELRARLAGMGLAVAHMSTEQLADREREYRAIWARIIRSSGFVPS